MGDSASPLRRAAREFYHASLPSDGLHIDGDVFDHTAGDIGSYPSASRKSALLSTYGGLELGPSGPQRTGAPMTQVKTRTRPAALPAKRS